MFIRILASVAVFLLAAVCAAPSTGNNLPDLLGLTASQISLATARSKLRGLRAQRILPGSPSDDISTWRKTRLVRFKRRAALPTFVNQTASGRTVRRRSKRGAIVNGFTSWDYEPFDKMGAFRTDRGD